MAIDQEQRQGIRRVYDYRCGYCGVHEEEAGSELEIDHFQPRSSGGGDDPENLVYCCTACNRRKGDFWPVDGLSASRRLLHPQRDDLAVHLVVEEDGQVTARTETGAFHIERLQLNRPPLISLRRARQAVSVLRQTVIDMRDEQRHLQQRIVTLEAEIDTVLEQLARLLRNEID